MLNIPACLSLLFSARYRLAAFACLVMALASSAAARSEVFANLTFDQALELSRQQGKLLVVDFTAAWCAPCQEMEVTTWVDVDVVAWLSEHAITIQVDADRHPQVTRRLNVMAYPTLVAFRDGREFDRIEGFAGPDRLLTWLEPVSRGVQPLDALRERADASGEAEDQFRLIQMLFQRDRVQEASDRALAMWDGLDNYRDALVRQPHAQILEILSQLASGHSLTRDRIAERRTALMQKISAGTADAREIQQWILLSAVLNDIASVVAWHDTTAGGAEGSGQAMLLSAGPLLEPLLASQGRYTAIGRLYADPVVRGREIAAQATATAADPLLASPQQQAGVRQFFMFMAAQVYAGLLSAGRDAEAVALADVIVENFGQDAAVVLVDQALKIGQPRREQQALLAAAVEGHAAGGAELLARLKRTVGDSGDGTTGRP